MPALHPTLPIRTTSANGRKWCITRRCLMSLAPRFGWRPALRTRYQSQIFALAHALNDEGASGRVVEPHGQDFLVFGRIVPALDRLLVGEFEDDDAFRLRSAFDQFGRAAPWHVPAAILRRVSVPLAISAARTG